MERLAIWIVGFVLKLNLSVEGRNRITVHLLDTLHALPLGDIIAENEDGFLTINGRTLDMEKARQLQIAADAALRNQSLSLIREQVKYEASIGAAVKATSVIDLLFYRAALWWGQEEEKYLRILAQKEKEPDL